jgi:hypothetical protein
MAGAINSSRLLQVLNAIRYNLRTERSSEGQGDGVAKGEHGEAGLDQQVYLEPRDPRWIEAWQITERVLVMMRDEAVQHGVPLLVVTLSQAVQVDPDPAVRADAMRQLGVNDLFYPERRLTRFLERERIPVLALAPQMQRYAQEHGVYLHGFRASGSLGSGHWNEEGHRLAGRCIANWIEGRYPAGGQQPHSPACGPSSTSMQKPGCQLSQSP